MGLSTANATSAAGQAPQLDVKGDGTATRFNNGPDSITLQQALDQGNSDIRAMYDFQARSGGLDPAMIKPGSEDHQQVMADLTKSIEVWSSMPDASKGPASAWRAFQFAAEETVTMRMNSLHATDQKQCDAMNDSGTFIGLNIDFFAGAGVSGQAGIVISEHGGIMPYAQFSGGVGFDMGAAAIVGHIDRVGAFNEKTSQVSGGAGMSPGYIKDTDGNVIGIFTELGTDAGLSYQESLEGGVTDRFSGDPVC